MLEPMLGSSIITNTNTIRLTVFLSVKVLSSLMLNPSCSFEVDYVWDAKDPKDIVVKNYISHFEENFLSNVPFSLKSLRSH